VGALHSSIGDLNGIKTDNRSVFVLLTAHWSPGTNWCSEEHENISDTCRQRSDGCRWFEFSLSLSLFNSLGTKEGNSRHSRTNQWWWDCI